MTASCLGFNHSLHQPPFSTGLPYLGYKSELSDLVELQMIYVRPVQYFMHEIPVDILHPDGTEAAPNELGRVAVKLPLPPGNMSTLYKNDEYFDKTYFRKFPVSRMYLRIMFCSYNDIDGIMIYIGLL